MFPDEKSIGGPAENTGSFSNHFKPQKTSIGYRKTLATNTVPCALPLGNGIEQGFERLSRKFACPGLGREPPVKSPAPEGPGLSSQQGEVQRRSPPEGRQQIIEDRLQRGIVLLQQHPGTGGARHRVALGGFDPSRKYIAANPIS
jgi:hypothetical protein